MAPSLSSCQDDMTFFTSILQHQHQLNHSSPRPAKNISVLHQMEEKVEQVQSKEDVTIYVGSKRKAYVLSIHSLRGSAFFHSLISSNPPFSPIFLDCQESVFENVLTILRYGTFSALPSMPTSHMFQLKRELQLLGIPLPPESSSPCPSLCSSPSSSSSSSSSASSSSISSVNLASPSPSPSRRSLSRNPSPLVEMPEFLENQEKLVLVSRSDGDQRWRCSSCQEAERNEWALNFHYRHAFCTACGQHAIPIMPPKLLAEMFMAAASYYSGKPANPRIWSIRSNSACTLTFVSSSNSNRCPSSSSSCCSPHDQMWALSSFFSHAFCTHCGNCADSKTLLDLLFKCRYGSLRRQIKSIRSSNNFDSKIQTDFA